MLLFADSQRVRKWGGGQNNDMEERCPSINAHSLHFILFIFFPPFTREFLRNLLQTRLFPNSLILFEGIIFFFCLFCVWWRLYCSVIAQWVVFISVCLRYEICFYFICTAFVHLLQRKFTKFFKDKNTNFIFYKASILSFYL